MLAWAECQATRGHRAVVRCRELLRQAGSTAFEVDLVTNIRRSDITAEVAWATLELEGEPERIEAGLRWVADRGIRVDPVEDSIIEG